MPFTDFTAARGDVQFVTNLGQFRAEMGEVEAVYGRTTGAMTDEALRMSVAQEKLNRAIARSGPESLAAGRATIAYRGELDRLAKSEAAAAAAAERAAKQRIAAYTAAAQTVGRSLTRYVTAPTALLTAAAVKMGIDYKQQLLLIQTQAGASATEVHKLDGEILQLAKSVPQGPQELVKAMFALESVGLRDQRALDALHVAAIASGEGMADLTTTTDVLAGSLVTGIKGTEDYQQAMDGLIAIAGIGKMHLQDLGDALGTGLLVKAKNAGLSLDQVGAALAVLTDRNIPARKAATQLGTTFALMQAPSRNAQKALEDMGIDSDQLAQTLREPNGLLKVLEMLHAGMQRVGKTRGAADILAAFGRSKQSGAILTLVESLDSAVSSYQQKLDQYQKGVAEAAANRETYLHSEAYKLHQALSTIEADLTSMGEKIAPAFVGAIDALAKLADGFSKLPRTAKTEIGVIVGLLAVGGPLLLAIAAVVRAVQTIGTAFRKLPADAGVAVAETDVELATLRATAAGTGAKIGTEISTGVGAGVTTAEGRLLTLRRSLLGLSGLILAPIVIPIVYKIEKGLFPSTPGVTPDVAAKGPEIAGLTLTAPKGTSASGLLAKLKAHKKFTAAEARALQSMLASGDLTGGVTPTSQQLHEILLAATDPAKYAALLKLRAGFKKGNPAATTGTDTTSKPVSFEDKLKQLQLAQLAAQAGYGNQQQADEQLIAFLQEQIRSGGLTKDQLQTAYQALTSAKSDLASLASAAASAAKKRADQAKQAEAARKRAYRAHLSAEETKLKTNEQRAKLAETRAGQNKRALDRAYKAEHRALTDEIAFYRKEAHDQQLTQAERARYAKLAASTQVARSKSDQAGHKAIIDAEDNALKDAVARARLAETQATQGTSAYAHALTSERKALTAEIDFYRKEAKDQQLALKDRQHYAKLAIAAETARAKIGKQQTKSTIDLAQAERDFLGQLRDVFLNFAPNVFTEAAKLRPNLTVNQSFPAPPTDQHRQARMAVGAMRAAFD